MTPTSPSAESDARLFADAPDYLRRLHKQARRELRQKDRKAFAKAHALSRFPYRKPD